MLLLGQRDLHHLLVDARRRWPRGRRAGRRPGAQDLEAALVERRGDLDGDRRGDRALAGQAIALADQVVAELDLVR